VVVSGRRFLYDARFSSSHGASACAGCHIFGDLDQLAWDLGDPNASVENGFHPMKGPMATQSFRGLENQGPLHWRGDRSGAFTPGGSFLDTIAAFHQFNQAFVGLLGRENRVTDQEMQAFAEFVMTISYPPNPIRGLDDSLTVEQKAGRDVYFNRNSDIISTCNGCHRLDVAELHFGTDGNSTFDAEPQTFKVPHLRNAYQKVGMFGMAGGFGIPDTGGRGEQIRGFGYTHDGSVDTLEDFLKAGVFALSEAEERQLASFMLAFDSDVSPVVGQQVTVTAQSASAGSARLGLLAQRALVTTPRRECDLIGKGSIAGTARGFVLQRDRTLAGDRAADAPVGIDALVASLTGADAITFTCMPAGSGRRAGIDRDRDGRLDGDEIDAGTDPADPSN
jgi:hypothetical protein